jgi:hypothetical protein
MKQLILHSLLSGAVGAAFAQSGQPISQPLVTHIYTADPSAHVFKNRIFIYPSHDVETGAPEDNLGNHFDMRDYHVFSMKKPGGKVKDHGKALDIADVPWAGRQMWAPDAAYHNGAYYLYFPVKDKEDIFRIGVAVSKHPRGPFKPEPAPIAGSYSIDPAVFRDVDGSFFMYFGGIWGGQLQNRTGNQYNPDAAFKKGDEIACLPRVAKLAPDMKSFAEEVREVRITDANGRLFTEAENDKRFFEAAWVHHYNGKYYFSYSTGDTHLICYAIGDSPYGPFTYQGKVLKPVRGWTNHHSIVEYQGQWYLFYHDTQLSGKTHLRNIKMTELTHLPDGSIQTIEPYE